MKLTKPEKLILIMLSEIHEKLGIKGEIDTKFLVDAIYEDHTWALSWEMPGIVGDDNAPTPPEVKEVLDILDMWESLERSYTNFNPADKKKIDGIAQSKAGARFIGFDGNNETDHMRIAKFLVEKMDRFGHFARREFNSHMPTLDRYLSMVPVFKSTRARLNSRGELSASAVIEILNAHRN